MAFTKQQLYTTIGAVSAVLILALAGTGLVYDVYVRRAEDVFAKTLGGPLPAAKVGSHTISYGDFLKSRDTLKTYLNSDLAKQENMSQPMTPDLEKSALERLVREAVIEELAEQKGLSVSKDEIQSAYNTFVHAAASSSQSDVPKTIKETFHWTEQEYQDNVIKPILLEQRVAATMATSTDAQGAALESYAEQRLAKPDVKYYLKF